MAESDNKEGVWGRTVILAGSCSEATKRQIISWRQAGGASVRIEPGELLEDFSVLEKVKEELQSMGKTLLIYSAGLSKGESVTDGEMGDGVSQTKGCGHQLAISSVLDQAFAELARYAKVCGCRGLIVAGGETSGAVTKALGYACFQVGKSIAPGVPILIPEQDRNMRLVLKSGNFGGERFFVAAEKAIWQGNQRQRASLTREEIYQMLDGEDI